jgi:hypothetical protein
MPSLVSTFTTIWLRLPTQTGYDFISVIFMIFFLYARKAKFGVSTQAGCILGVSEHRETKKHPKALLA